MSITGVVGRGLAAGVVGTAASTIAEKADAARAEHGGTMGVVRASLDVAGMSRRSASIAFFALLWGSDAALYATLGIAPPPWRWSFGDLAMDLYGKGALAFATSGAYVAIGKAT